MFVQFTVTCNSTQQRQQHTEYVVISTEKYLSGQATILHYTSIAYSFNHYLDEATDVSSEAGIAFTARYLSRDGDNENWRTYLVSEIIKGHQQTFLQKYKLWNCSYAFTAYCLFTIL